MNPALIGCGAAAAFLGLIAIIFWRTMVVPERRGH